MDGKARSIGDEARVRVFNRVNGNLTNKALCAITKARRNGAAVEREMECIWGDYWAVAVDIGRDRPLFEVWPALVRWSQSGRTVYGPWRPEFSAPWIHHVAETIAWITAGGTPEEGDAARDNAEYAVTGTWDGLHTDLSQVRLLRGDAVYEAARPRIERLRPLYELAVSLLADAPVGLIEPGDAVAYARRMFAGRVSTFGDLLIAEGRRFRVITRCGDPRLWVARRETHAAEVARIIAGD